MVLKTRLEAKLDLPLVFGFYRFSQFLPDQIGIRFLVESVELAGLI